LAQGVALAWEELPSETGEERKKKGRGWLYDWPDGKSEPGDEKLRHRGPKEATHGFIMTGDDRYARQPRLFVFPGPCPSLREEEVFCEHALKNCRV